MFHDYCRINDKPPIGRCCVPLIPPTIFSKVNREPVDKLLLAFFICSVKNLELECKISCLLPLITNISKLLTSYSASKGALGNIQATTFNLCAVPLLIVLSANDLPP